MLRENIILFKDGGEASNNTIIFKDWQPTNIN